ncbi:MAG: cation diffusion facilitator family transporter [Clostridia bacterium]|nr:cation diffusion facilitator family transporter [Clostridia bacterium]
MVDYLGKLFVKDADNVTDRGVRRAWGTLVSIVGIILNIVLFIGKFTVGFLFGAISISADAVNNLSDAGTQLISLFSFKMAARPADRKHPFGHARTEYVASMIVSVIIFIVGVTLFRDSVEKVIENLKGNDETVFSWISVGVLAVSILAKFWLSYFNKKVGKKIGSSVMEATATDSLSDAFATSAVLVALLVFRFTGFNPDAYLSVAVSVLIIVAGTKILREMMELLIGETPDPEFIKEITDFVMSFDGILGVHDLLIHGYGPNCSVISLHAEVDGAVDVFVTHDIIDNIESEMFRKFGAQTTIHLDPIVTDDAEVTALRTAVLDKMKEINRDLMIHDFRFVRGTSHSNLIFDIAAPFELNLTDDEIIRIAQQKVTELDDSYLIVVKVDRC